MSDFPIECGRLKNISSTFIIPNNWSLVATLFILTAVYACCIFYLYWNRNKVSF